MNSLSAFCLRIGLGVVFVIFGYDKLNTPTNWLLYVPPDLPRLLQENVGATIYDLFRWQGVIELVIGAQLLVGFFTRFWAFVACLLLASIVTSLGFDPTGVRDFGLLFMALGLFFLGGGLWSIDSKLKTPRPE